MASANWMIRGRQLRSRALRYRSDNEEDRVKIDYDKDTKQVLHEILTNVCQKQHQSEVKTLAYLNAFVKLLNKLNQSSNPNDLGYSLEDILLCMRAVLVQESVTVRSAGLRVLRHLLKTKQSVLILNKIQIPVLIARSLDLVVQNHNERVQALQLIRHILNIAPELFPLQAARAVVAAAFPATTDNDRLIRSCLAVLCELCVSNPDMFIACGGVKALMHNLPTLQSPQIIEAIIGVLLYLMNKPGTRNKALIDLHCFVANFLTDIKTKDSENILAASCWCLLSLLRSWTGVLHFCNPNSHGLVSYVASLRLNQPSVRKAVLNLTFDLLNLKQPEWTDNVTVALNSIDPCYYKESYKLTEDFVAAEGISALPSLSKCRVNLIETHTAFLLYCFLKAGLLEALIEVIVAPDMFLSIRATILLGEILHLTHFLLPPECCNLSPALPNLVSYAVRGRPVIFSPKHLGMTGKSPPKNTVEPTNKMSNYAKFSTEITSNMRSSTVLAGQVNTSSETPSGSKSRKSSDKNTSSVDAEYSNLSNLRHEIIGRPGIGSQQVDNFVREFSRCYVNAFENPGDYLNQISVNDVDFNLYTNYFKSESDACIHSQQRAISAVTTLTHLHDLMQKKSSPTSIYLNHIINNVESKNVIDLVSLAKLKCKQSSSKNKIQSALLKECDEQIKESEVLTQKSPFLWHWDMIRAVLKLRVDFRLDDSNHNTFIKNLIMFLKPSNKYFSGPHNSMPIKKANVYVLSGCDLLDFLCETDGPEASSFITDFINDLNQYLEELIKAKSVHDCFFNPLHVTNSLCHFYFLFLGHLSRSEKGREFLVKLKVFERLGNIALSISHEIYMKLVISTLDYSVDSPAREILSQVLSSPNVPARLYATKYLHVLLRTRLEVKDSLAKWVIELLVNQLYDENKSVSLTAINALNEACDHKPYLEKMIAIKPSLLHLRDRGLLLLIRFLSTIEGFKYLQEANFVMNELQRWANHFNYKYVCIVESELHDSLSQQQRDEEGRYIKHHSGSKHRVSDVFVPPHLYSQLVQHEEGFKLLLSDPGFNALIPILLNSKCDTDKEILDLKASMWALGHVAAAVCGAKYLIEHGVVSAIKELVLNAPVFSIRATAYYFMSMLAMTRQGVAALHVIGWECVRHSRNDEWPVVSPPSYMSFSSFSNPSSPKQESYFGKSFYLADNDIQDSSVSWNHLDRDSFSRKSATLPSSTSHHFQTLSNVHIRSLSESKADNCEDLSITSDKFNFDSSDKLTGKSQEPGTKHRSDSLCTDTSTSGISSCDSTNSKHHIIEHIQTLAPIPSASCLESVKSSKSLVPHLTFDQFKSNRRLHYQNLLGYTTLRSLNWHRRPQLIPSISTTAALELITFQDLKQMSPLVRPKLSSKHTLRVTEPEEFSLLNELNLSFSESYLNNSSNLPFHVSDDHDTSHDGKPTMEEPIYRGICLPLKLESVFSSAFTAPLSQHNTISGKKVKKKKEDGSSGESEEEAAPSVPVEIAQDKEARKQHDKSSCLLCINKTSDKTSRIRKVSNSSFHRIRTETESSYGVIGDEESPILLPWQQKTAGLLDNPGLESGESAASTSEEDTNAARQSLLAGNSLGSRSCARKQLLKLVEQLYNPILHKTCKQGLLYLKQLCGDLFQDLCVYSDICVLMAMCPHRAPARRLVQELFLDAHFNELFEEAATIIACNMVEPIEDTASTSANCPSAKPDLEGPEQCTSQGAEKKVRHNLEVRKNNLDSNNTDLEVILELDSHSEANKNNVCRDSESVSVVKIPKTDG